MSTPRLLAEHAKFWMREAEGGETRVAAAHFPGMQFGRLLQGERGRTFTFV